MNNNNRIILKDLFGKYCITLDDGNYLYKKIVNSIKNKKEIIIDFEEIETCISVFLNASFGKLMKDYDWEEIKNYIILENINEDIKFNIDLILENSRKYYNDAEYREAVDIALRNEFKRQREEG
jgi:uncharacterized protein (DUF1330 family)